MKNFVKVVAYYAVGSAASVIGMFGGAWLWAEVLKPKAEEMKEKHQEKVSNKEEGLA